MTKTDYFAPAELYLGTNWNKAHQQGSRAFRTAAQAIRFALEEAAPVSLRGALLTVGGRAFSSRDIKEFYRNSEYPLPRK